MNNRPIGVSILAVLHVIGGVFLLGIQGLLMTDFNQVSSGMRSLGIPPILLVLGLMLLAGIALASGIGMWLGTRWGWWFGTFYYVYSIARSINALLMVSDVAEELAAGSRGPSQYYLKYGGRALFQLLLLLYFFRPNVLEFFGMQDIHKGKAIGILVGITAAIFALVTGIGLIAE